MKRFSLSATYYDCGICGQYHPIEWNGDCREDASRFTLDELDSEHLVASCPVPKEEGDDGPIVDMGSWSKVPFGT